MSLVVLTGAVRSGKSAAAERLAASLGRPVVVAAAGWEGDPEMARRIAAHRGVRPDSWSVCEAGIDPAWVTKVPIDSVLLVDCLSTLVGAIAWEEAGDADMADGEQEGRAHSRASDLVAAFAAREGDTVVVSNEAGWGVVPATAAGRLFRDVLGRSNRDLVKAADAAYLVVAGRFMDLKTLDGAPAWPKTANARRLT